MAGHQPCTQCSAPLEMGPPGTIVRCAYCRTDNRMAALTGVMPAMGGPPPPSPHSPQVTEAQSRLFRRLIYFIIAVTVIPPLLMVLIWIVVAAVGLGTAVFLEYRAH